MKRALLEELRAILPPESLIDEAEALRPYECDGLTALRTLPLAVTLPDTEEQVKHILQCCRRHGAPVVARGAGTGLSGGAQPHEDGIILSLAKFNRIRKLDPDSRTAVVEPGVRNIAISEAARPHGLYYAPDPSSQIACTIGGNVAENSGGLHCLKYGLTVHNIQKLRVMTIDGEMLTIGSDALDAPGYDLLALMTGSEGLLGIILEITVKLLPVPPLARVIMAAFDSVETAGEAVGRIIANGIIPGGLE
ncbi:MAG: FAD-binding protein, partial [Sedimenticolaceae bacterium]|nr:FAD-binding protein [Sedimenticolaceae bacterium]